MHEHHIAHLDISLRNIVTDYEGHYAYIDYEASRRFNETAYPLIFGYRGTEVPPECERGEFIDPYKVDVWALAVMMLRACKVPRIFYLPTCFCVSDVLPVSWISCSGAHACHQTHGAREPLSSPVNPFRPARLRLHAIDDRRSSMLNVSLVSDCAIEGSFRAWTNSKLCTSIKYDGLQTCQICQGS